MDPYEVLGLTYPSSKEEIRARYHQLAKQHHPDKLSHLSIDEKEKHEQKFKKINVAYELLTKSDFNNTSKTEWKGMWSYVENMMNNPEVVQNMGEVLQKMFNIVKEYKKANRTDHHISVPVTLEEIHIRKEKKLRLFLKNIDEPVFIAIDCGTYPSFTYTHIHNDKTLIIHITFELKLHNFYSIDFLYNSNDIFCQVNINLDEYFSGTTKDILYLDGTKLQVYIPPFNKDEIVIENKGLHYNGKLTIYINVNLPSKNDISENKISKLVKYLKLLSYSNHYSVKSI